MTTQSLALSENMECPLCLGEGKLKRTEVLDRLGVKDFARVAQLSAEEAFRLLQQNHTHDYHDAWARFESELAKRTAEIRRGDERPQVRCEWARSELAIRYHDEEWGVPVHHDGTLFEFLVLEGAQAGLSWETILNKRENYRAAFDGFDAQRVARYDRRKIAQLLRNPGIVRNRLKIASAVRNAQAVLRVQEEYGSFDRYVWQFVDGRPRVNSRKARSRVPARTAESDAMSKALKKRGFNFVGSTICYAFMQAVGMVNDHAAQCFRHGGAIGAK